jgi:plastocyanin
MRKFVFTAILSLLVLTLALAAAGCGEASSGGGSSNELDMGSSSFTQSSITLTSGQVLHIVDSQDSGGTHNLCIGQNGTCDANPSGSTDLGANGTMFSPGTTKDITFSGAGTYHITCTIHPSMNVTITVQ